MKASNVIDVSRIIKIREIKVRQMKKKICVKKKRFKTREEFVAIIFNFNSCWRCFYCAFQLLGDLANRRPPSTASISCEALCNETLKFDGCCAKFWCSQSSANGRAPRAIVIRNPRIVQNWCSTYLIACKCWFKSRDKIKFLREISLWLLLLAGTSARIAVVDDEMFVKNLRNCATGGRFSLWVTQSYANFARTGAEGSTATFGACDGFFFFQIFSVKGRVRERRRFHKTTHEKIFVRM